MNTLQRREIYIPRFFETTVFKEELGNAHGIAHDRGYTEPLYCFVEFLFRVKTILDIPESGLCSTRAAELR